MSYTKFPWDTGDILSKARMLNLETQYDEAIIDLDAYKATRLIAKKPSEQIVNNSSTLVNATDLLLAVEANTTYYVILLMRYISSGTADFKATLTIPAGANIQMFTIYETTVGALSMYRHIASGATPFIRGYGDDQIHIIQGLVITAGAAGNIQAQFAQSTPTVEDTKCFEDSCLMAFKME